MFMIEKSLIVIMFVYSVGFSLLGAQYVFADVFGVNLIGINGQPIKSNIINYINQNNILSSTQNATSTSRSSVVNNPVGAAAGIAWELILLISGTYVFNILLLFGIPSVIIAGLVSLYFFLLIRAIVGYIRGI